MSLTPFTGIDRDTLSKKAVIDKVFETRMLDFDPGSREAYGNFGYLLLGEVIEKVTGGSFLDYINGAFGSPLGITFYQATSSDLYKGRPYRPSKSNRSCSQFSWTMT